MTRELSNDLWNHCRIDLTVERLVGGTPANPKLLDTWLETNKAGSVGREDAALVNARLVEEGVEQHTVAFARDEKGNPCFESRALKAALKEAANVLKARFPDIGYPRARLAEQVFVGPKLVPIERPILVGERVLHVLTAKGPRDSLKRYEYAEDVNLKFTCKILKGSGWSLERLGILLTYIKDGGIGADRSQGSGTLSEAYIHE